MMTGQPYDPEFVEFIVQEVLRRLKSAGFLTGGSPLNPSTEASSRELVLEERLVTLATLHGRLNGVEQIVVKRKALITPAVRDELKKRNIVLRHQ